MRLKCEGIIAPDQHEPNDNLGEPDFDLPTGIGDYETIASISPQGDVDTFIVVPQELCIVNTTLCDVGSIVTLTSDNPNVVFDAQNPASGDPQETNLVEWHTGPMKVPTTELADFVRIVVHSPDVAKYTLTFSNEIP